MARVSSSSIASTIKAYSVPLLLFSLAMLYQLVILPRSFPPSHYDVLGLKRHSSMEAVEEVYQNISSKWNSGVEVPSIDDFVKIRYAYELLKNPIWKRDYDIFGIEEQLHVIDKVKGQSAGENFSHIELPLLDAAVSDHEDQAFSVITSNDFRSMFQNSRPWLIEVYSSGSSICAQFFNSWKRIAALLDGIANTGMVELGDIQLATYLAERKRTGQFFFRNGLPSLVACPPGCRTSDCLARFEGELSVDAVTNWFATTILNLPRILFYSKESLGPNFLAKSGPHKVKVIFFSKTGERATPFVRQAAKNYWAYASFACVLWREEESSFWWNTFEVESAPAIVVLKDPGVKPVVYHGLVNNSQFLNILEQNKQQELPQLRSITSMELGCDARGYSRAGYDATTWYCVILAGRLGPELNQMRETIRRVQGMLSSDCESSAADNKQSSSTATMAMKNKRLTFAWLDGETQEKYCFFYLHSETSYETCGPRRAPDDVPRVFIVRYKKNDTEDNIKVEKKPKSMLAFQFDEPDPAAQLVVSYNGSAEVSEIINWISETVKDGDSKNLPFYRAKTPELVPEDAEPIWSRGAQSVISNSIGIKQRMRNIITGICDYLGDPRIGPALLLLALMSFGTIWLKRSQPTIPSQSSQPSLLATNDEARPKQRRRARNLSDNDPPPSITDVDVKDAYQMPLSDSDSE
ncbi:hypothetical protein CFOL_v3_28111 [Cephalotus follicularis]|uniref:J domain-containing protein n=1 Tax=Cephalotus follicularis TaxID=3775 RepID=A0A1Q3CWR2_CEPFO|nr:hypothetical protein CFOL_v3_28111 [Cephalotus follicularis]